MKQPYDAIRLVISNIATSSDAEAWRAFLADEGWTVGTGWGADDIVAWAAKREDRTVPTRRTLAEVLRKRLAAEHGDPGAVTLNKGEAVIDLTYYRAVDRK